MAWFRMPFLGYIKERLCPFSAGYGKPDAPELPCILLPMLHLGGFAEGRCPSNGAVQVAQRRARWKPLPCTRAIRGRAMTSDAAAIPATLPVDRAIQPYANASEKWSSPVRIYR